MNYIIHGHRLVPVFLIIVQLLIGDVDATQCYECSTYLSAWCRDPFDYVTPIQPTNCSHAIVTQKHSMSAVLENLLAVLGSGDRDENGSGLNDLRKKRVAELIGRYKRDIAILESRRRDALERDTNTTTLSRKRRQAAGVTEQPHDEGFKCFKIAFTGVRGTNEVFRGCEPIELLDVCDMVLNYNGKSKDKTKYCDVCDNDLGNETDPNPDHAPPCNRAAIYLRFDTLVLTIGFALSIVDRVVWW